MNALSPTATGPAPWSGLRLELAKMRRLHSLPVAAAIASATVALSSMPLFQADHSDFVRSGSHLWEQLLMSYTMISAITGPILASVLDSRQTDIEHAGAGWALFATAGRTPGALCRAKLGALALIIGPAIALQSAVLVSCARFAGVTLPLQALPWALYTGEVIAVTLALCAFHVWLAAVKDNQLIGVGVGLIGSFIGVYMLLAPSWAARLVPWGYYAVISCVMQTDPTVRGLVYVTPPLAWVGAFVVAAALLFTAATRGLDRIER